MARVSRGGPFDRLAVQRLDGIHIHDARRDAFGFQSFLRADSLRHQQAGGDDGEVAAVDQLDGLADFKALLAGMHDGDFRPPGADEDRPEVSGGGQRPARAWKLRRLARGRRNPGSEQASPKSSMLICDGPSSPIEMPLCVPTTFKLTFG